MARPVIVSDCSHPIAANWRAGAENGCKPLCGGGRGLHRVVKSKTLALMASGTDLLWRPSMGARRSDRRWLSKASASGRLEERRVGTECVSTCSDRWSLFHQKTKTTNL